MKLSGVPSTRWRSRRGKKMRADASMAATPKAPDTEPNPVKPDTNERI